MGIVDEDILRVREVTDIVALITQYTQLKRVGQRWSGLCPFHSEKTPSFSVNASEGFYYCFGCKEHGDAITFVRNMEHLDFVGAVERLAGTVTRYVQEAVAVERSGATLDPAPEPEVAAELQERLDADPKLKAAFEALTPGRRRFYNIHISEAKQSATRAARVEKCIPKILAGKGLQDR